MTGAGTWVLSGTSSYTGPTTLTAGLLSVGAAANLGASSANLVFDGGGLRITGTTLTKLSDLGRTVIFNPGVTVTFDIADAGNTFTVDQAIPDSVTIVKVGAGNLLFDPPYAGAITITSGATLQYDDGAVISTRPLLNNGTLIVNRSGTDAQGSSFHSIMGGTGSLTKSLTGTLVLNGINVYTGTTRANAGTITLSHPLAIMNSAIDTTGAGAITLSGVNSPIFGGLTGTVAAATAITGYGSVTALTLNPQTGITFTYGGVIANGSGAMSLTKTGAGTQVLGGVNTYTGATYLKEGTLSLGPSGTILNTAITFNNGSLTLQYSGATSSDRISNSDAITSNGGTWTQAFSSAGPFSETIGTVDLASGQFNLVATGNPSSGNSPLTLSGLTRSGATAALTVAPTANGTFLVSGASQTSAGQIIGPWATYGTTAAAQTDYAVYDSSSFIKAANITASTEDTWTTAANAYTLSGATTLTGTRTITALRYTGSTGTLGLGNYNLETYGVLNGAAGSTLTISAGSGALTTPSGGGSLFLTPGANNMIVSAPINDNGGAVTLVKNGGSTLNLSGAKNYTGGTVLNAGTLNTTADNQLGVGGGVTVNGTVTWNGGDIYNHARSLTINEGGNLTLNNGNGVTGVFSGNGTLRVTTSDDFNFTNASNTFSGAIFATTATALNYGLTFASIGDGVGAGLISLGGVGTPGTIRWVKASGGTTTFANRQFALSGTTGGGAISALGTASAENLIINKDLLVTGVGNKTLTLAGSNTGNNTFAGNISDGPGSVISLLKAEVGSWILSGNNTYSGTTTVSAGTLVLRGEQSIADANTVNITSGKIEVETREAIGALQFGGTNQVAGIWGTVASGAENTNDARFSGTGLLYVGVPFPPSGTVIIVK